MTKFRAVCESADCTPLLEKVQVGFLGSLDDVKRDGLHLTVKQTMSNITLRLKPTEATAFS